MLCEEGGHGGSVHEDVLMVLVVSPPGAVLFSEEGGDLADEDVLPRDAEAGDDGPVVAHAPMIRLLVAQRAVQTIAEVEGKNATRSQGIRGCRQRALDRSLVREVVEYVPHGDDRIAFGQRIVRKDQLPDVRARGRLARDLEHGRRRVGRDHAVAGVNEVAGQETAATAELEDRKSTRL